MKKYAVAVLLSLVLSCSSCANSTDDTDQRVESLITSAVSNEVSPNPYGVDYTAPEEPLPEEPEVLAQYKELYEANPDMIGAIYLPSGVCQPVLQRLDDQNYYLDHNFFCEEDKEGSVFANSFTYLGESGVSLLYGHTLKSGRMFSCLHNYLDEEYFQEHKVMRLDTLYSEMEYEVVAVALTSLHDEFLYYSYVGKLYEAEFNQWRDGFEQYCMVGSLSELSHGDIICELSCCAYHVKDGRLVVVLKAIAGE